MIVLGIETSCDETSIALVRNDKQILSNQVFSQINDHQAFGGVVPELAARSHLEALERIFTSCLHEASISIDQVTAVAATCGPGLIGGLIIGSTFGKTLAYSNHKPFIPVNHLEAHALTPRLTSDVEFPYLLLLMSGGHCQIVIIDDIGKYQTIGSTLDDAIGESFDKVAKMLNLPYPGGPSIEKAAHNGNPDAFLFPTPLIHQPSCSFSFSGLKTAVRYTIEKLPNLSSDIIADIAASFQKTVIRILINRMENAFRFHPHIKTLVVAGGVASNTSIRLALTNLCQTHSILFSAPPPSLCTDNGAMIAWAGIEHIHAGFTSDLYFHPRPRWPLEEIKNT